MEKNCLDRIWIHCSNLCRIYEIATFDEKLLEDPEYQATLQAMNSVYVKLLDLCMTTENLIALEGCKNESLPKIIEDCKERNLSTMSVCSDSRINEFSDTIGQRLQKANEQVEVLKQELAELEEKKEYLENIKIEPSEDIFEYADDSVTAYIELCIKYPSERCTKDAIQMLNLCNIDASVAACGDPRLKEIANFVHEE